MGFHIITTSFLIFSIFLFVLTAIVFNKAFHSYGQRFVAGTLFCFGCAYLIEVLIYILPKEYTYFLQVWVVHSLSLFGLSLISHYLYFLIKRHAILNISFTPPIFYLYCFLYIAVIGPFELLKGQAVYVKEGSWYIRENVSPSIYFYIIVPVIIFKILYLLMKGIKYAPSEKRKKLYKIYLSGGIGTIFMSLITIAFISGEIFSPDVAILVSFVPFLLIIGIENYLYSPGFAKYYNKIIELSPIALVVLNRDFEIVEINSRAKQWFKMKKYDHLLDRLKTEENINEAMRFLKDLQSKNEVDDYHIKVVFRKEIHFSISASILELDDEYYYYVMLRDISKEYEQEKRNYYLAYHDALTSLYNRTYFTTYVHEKLQSYHETKKGAIILSDLNFFKKINDTYGHHVGDEVLIHTAKLISSKVVEPNIVARFGGDEFIVYLDHIECEKSLQEKIENMRQLFKKTPFVKDNIEIEVIPSFGYAIITEGMRYEELYQKADQEMYKDKRLIKAQYNKNELIVVK